MDRTINYDAWSDRPKALLVKELMQQFNISLTEIATLLGTSVSYIHNKLSRNSISFEDLLILFRAANLKINVTDEHGDIWKTIALRDWYPEDEEKIDAILKSFEEEKQKVHREKYLKLKNELENMKELYGFED